MPIQLVFRSKWHRCWASRPVPTIAACRKFQPRILIACKDSLADTRKRMARDTQLNRTDPIISRETTKACNTDDAKYTRAQITATDLRTSRSSTLRLMVRFGAYRSNRPNTNPVSRSDRIINGRNCENGGVAKWVSPICPPTCRRPYPTPQANAATATSPKYSSDSISCA